MAATLSAERSGAFEKRWHAALFSFSITGFCLIAVRIYVTSVYPPEMMDLVGTMSPLITAALAAPLSYGVGILMHRNALLRRELQRIISRDRLTEAATRDAFFAAMENDPQSEGVALVVDIDHFKSVNDTYGHITGDEVLRKVASAMFTCIHDRDILCRFGGEEFVIFLRRATSEQAEATAEMIRQRIAHVKVIDSAGVVQVTASVGGALKSGHRDIDAAISEADGALYAAKRGGRNRTAMSWRKAA